MITMRDRENRHAVHGVEPLPREREAARPLLDQIAQHPYAALALAAGLGFAIGRGPLSRASSRVLAAGMRAAVPVVLAPVAAALVDMVSALGSHARHSRAIEEERA